LLKDWTDHIEQNDGAIFTETTAALSEGFDGIVAIEATVDRKKNFHDDVLGILLRSLIVFLLLGSGSVRNERGNVVGYGPIQGKRSFSRLPWMKE
jgi:hypothetical protein